MWGFCTKFYIYRRRNLLSFLILAEFDSNFKLLNKQEFNIPDHLMIHDWAFTDNHYILFANRVKLDVLGNETILFKQDGLICFFIDVLLWLTVHMFKYRINDGSFWIIANDLGIVSESQQVHISRLLASTISKQICWRSRLAGACGSTFTNVVAACWQCFWT